MSESEVTVGSIVYICNICDINCGDPQLMIHHVRENHSFSNEKDAFEAVTAYEVQDISDSNEDKKLWSKEATFALIQLVEEYDNQFQKSVKNHIWLKIASIINTNMDINITWQQCDTKWKSLKKSSFCYI
ncbi:hypothetical protein JTB14_032345 [Gonioctena quinquepunctata]|nr:hypothetical protein JTB14_032345 [Gonioctena quinquepunctata]